MTDRQSCRIDASAPQPAGIARFSWSGFCKTDMVTRYASIPEHACDEVWAHPEHNRCPVISSRRIQWRNSLSFPRSWCPLFRPPAHAKPLSPLSSRSTRRSMSSQRRAKANSTKTCAGRRFGAAPPLRLLTRPLVARRGVLCSAAADNFLWPSALRFASVMMSLRASAQGDALPGRYALPNVTAPLPHRRSRCPKSHLRWSLGRPSQFRPAPARRQPPSLSMLSLSWSSRLPARVNTAKTAAGRAVTPDPGACSAARCTRRGAC